MKDGLDAYARRKQEQHRRHPIRLGVDLWLVMRDDPVLPAAVIRRIRHRGGESFVVVTWDLEPAGRLMTGRFATLAEADASVRYTGAKPVAPSANESVSDVEKRRQEQVRQEREARDRLAKNYGP